MYPMTAECPLGTDVHQLTQGSPCGSIFGSSDSSLLRLLHTTRKTQGQRNDTEDDEFDEFRTVYEAADSNSIAVSENTADEEVDDKQPEVSYNNSLR
jgi:hypothetical protein